jgi:hypothetical protein
MERTLEPPSTMFSWRQTRHGRNHRRPQTHTEERMERDEMTYAPSHFDELAPCLICGEPKPNNVRCDCWDREEP